ncbi:hypothetical protein BDY19DRAFT_442598 [Irpex rosettiformis]|uniref:Uncharacterized protein n=1 Tax=Irpex rosettiformis TaxID=378272 RepID=A0ACB8TU96_9APHY|nr:hypothetical protein BDY19DRAFT_442598 [Irpex rosettiformis]
MMSAPQAKFTIAIVGGGIGGLALAVALAKTGTTFDVDIYESTASFGEIGAGLGVWPRVWNTLVSLGLEEDLKARSTTMGEDGKMVYYKADQAESINSGKSKQAMQFYHRAEFLKILEKHVPPSYRTHFGKRLVSYEDSSPDPIVLHFKDGTTAQCDMLVGADGIRSAVRRAMFTALAAKAQDDALAATYRQCVDATWSGVVTYRALVQADAFKADYPNHAALSTPICYMGKHAIALSYPISQGQLVNTVALVVTPNARGTTYEGSWVTETDNDEMISYFSHWDPQVYALLKAMKNPSKWAVHELTRLPTFVSGRVALLGDAGHAMTPHLASGAGQAVEDALFLSTLLGQSETTKATIPSALAVYDEIRRPFAQHIQELSFKTGEIAWLDGPRTQSYSAEECAAGRIPESVLQQTISEDMAGVQRWTWTTDPQADLKLAVEKLKAKVEL